MRGLRFCFDSNHIEAGIVHFEYQCHGYWIIEGEIIGARGVYIYPRPPDLSSTKVRRDSVYGKVLNKGVI